MQYVAYELLQYINDNNSYPYDSCCDNTTCTICDNRIKQYKGLMRHVKNELHKHKRVYDIYKKN